MTKTYDPIGEKPVPDLYAAGCSLQKKEDARREHPLHDVAGSKPPVAATARYVPGPINRSLSCPRARRCRNRPARGSPRPVCPRFPDARS